MHFNQKFSFKVADITVDDQRIIGIIYDKAGFCTLWFFDMFFLNIVNLYFFSAPGLE